MPLCKRCWRSIDFERKENIKLDYNRDVLCGMHGEKQIFCEIRGCWNLVKKKKTGEGLCYEHVDFAMSMSQGAGPADYFRDIPRRTDRSRSPQRRQLHEAVARLRTSMSRRTGPADDFRDMPRKTDRSRSPRRHQSHQAIADMPRKTDRSRSPRRRQLHQAIARLRAGLEMMQNAITDVAALTEG